MFHRKRKSDYELTPKELVVLKWICQGKSNPEIAIILGNSPLTIKNHCHRIQHCLGVENRISAVLESFRRGIVPLPELYDKS